MGSRRSVANLMSQSTASGLSRGNRTRYTASHDFGNVAVNAAGGWLLGRNEISMPLA